MTPRLSEEDFSANPFLASGVIVTCTLLAWRAQSVSPTRSDVWEHSMQGKLIGTRVSLIV